MHTGDRCFICRLCGKAFYWKGSLGRHMTTHTGDKPFKCSRCKNAFTSQHLLNKHEQKHTEVRAFKCNTCNKAYYAASELKVHTMAHSGEKPYICKRCGRRFLSVAELNKNHKMHNGYRCLPCFICRLCGKAFYCKGSLGRHMAAHTGDKPFKCSRCKNAFTSQHLLNIHEQKHTEVRAFKCNTCNKAYYTASELKVHVAAHTKEPWVKNNGSKSGGLINPSLTNEEDHDEFECSECDFKCLSEDVIIRHSAMHKCSTTDFDGNLKSNSGVSTKSLLDKSIKIELRAELNNREKLAERSEIYDLEIYESKVKIEPSSFINFTDENTNLNEDIKLEHIEIKHENMQNFSPLSKAAHTPAGA